MRSGIETTFRLLTKTENRTAVDLLALAMDGEDREIRLRAVDAALTRPDIESSQAVFERLDRLDPQSHAVLNARGAALVDSVRAALTTDDARTLEEICDRICSARLYDAIPPLLEAVRVREPERCAALSDAVLRLTDDLYSEVRELHAGSEDVQRTLLLLRRRSTAALETGAKLWAHHRQDAVVEAYLLLATPNDPTLDAMLRNDTDPVHEAAKRVLRMSRRGGIVRLLLAFLSEPRMPHVVREAITARSDLKFAQSLLRSVGERPTRALQDKLKLFKGFQWARPDHPVLNELDEQSQTVAAEVFAATAADRDLVAQFVEHQAMSPNVGGRRGAARALDALDRVRAGKVIITGLNDSDPEVRAAMTLHLRPHRVPQALVLLVRMVDDPAPEVHEAVRKAMPEFRVRRFLRNYEQISEELVPVAGELIRKIDDLDGPELLEAEMRSDSSLRRRRAIEVTVAMGLVGRFESELIELLADENHTVRKKAVEALSTTRSRHAQKAIISALYDPSPLVQEAAEIGLCAVADSLREDLESGGAREADAPEEAPLQEASAT